MSLPVGDDGLGQSGSDLRQAAELIYPGRVDVYPFSRSERLCPPNGAVTLGQGRAGREGGEELDLTGRLPRPGSKMAYGVTGHRQPQEKQQGATFRGRHGTTVRR
jgi:hypothetical protein